MRTRRRQVAFAAALLAGAGLVGGIAAAPALAHAGTIQLGQNSATVSSNHRTLQVCDGEDDGRSVYAQVQYSWWGLPATYSDAYGGGCTSHSLYVSPAPLQWRFCESEGGCSSWRPV